MSKTIRRKNEQWDFNRHTGVEIILPFNTSHSIKVKLNKDTKEYCKKLAQYHSDKKLYRSSVPKWFIKVFCNKPMRQENRIQIRKWMLNTETELLLPVFMHDAGWYYF